MAKATSHICEVEKELGVLKVQHVQVRKQTRRQRRNRKRNRYSTKSAFCPQYVTENESSLQQVKAMLAGTQKDKVELANQLEEEKR